MFWPSENRWMTKSPLDESGRPAGVVAIVVETTERSGDTLFQCDAVRRECLFSFRRYQEFDEAFGRILGSGALVITAAVYGIELWRPPGKGPRSFMPGVVAMSGIVPAAKSLPLPFNTGLNMSSGAVRAILGLRSPAIPSRSRTAAKACPDLTLLKTIRSAPSKVFLNLSMVDMSYGGTVHAVREANTNASDHRSDPRTRNFPELVSSRTKSGSTTTTSAISPASILFFTAGPGLHSNVT